MRSWRQIQIGIILISVIGFGIVAYARQASPPPASGSTYALLLPVIAGSRTDPEASVTTAVTPTQAQPDSSPVSATLQPTDEPTANLATSTSTSTPSATTAASATGTASATLLPSLTITPSATHSPTITPSQTATSTDTPTATPSPTDTSTPTATPSPTDTSTPTATPIPLQQGQWRVTTQQGRSFYFYVYLYQSQYYVYGVSSLTIQAGSCQRSTYDDPGSVAFTNNQFSKSLIPSTLTMQGTFTSATSAAGTLEFVDTNNTCGGSVSIPWTAQWVMNRWPTGEGT